MKTGRRTIASPFRSVPGVPIPRFRPSHEQAPVGDAERKHAPLAHDVFGKAARDAPRDLVGFEMADRQAVLEA